jgi:hypothetical protein
MTRGLLRQPGGFEGFLAGLAERAVYLRTLLYEPADISEIASHKEALAILSLVRAAPPQQSRSSALFAITPGATTSTTSCRGCSTTNNRPATRRAARD